MPGIFSYPPITGVTINTVYLSPVFRHFLYLSLATILIVAVLALRLKRKLSWSVATRRGLLTAFFAAGILYGVHAEIGWATWVSKDLDLFRGLSTDEKLYKLESDLFIFSRAAREAVGTSDYQLFAPDTYLRERTEYFLLPARKREKADVVLVLADPSVQYDGSSGVLLRDGQRIEGLRIVHAFTQNILILRKR